MKSVGIIAEYNPFHNGHRFHLEETRRKTGADCVVCVMSGSFMQRGDPGIADKWRRAEMAVRNGADLVLELPFAFACNNAEYFAQGAVGILNGLGCIDYLSFGSESGRLDKLMETAGILAVEEDRFKRVFREKLKEGLSFPKARYEAFRQLHNNVAEVLKDPNNILAVEYLKQLIRTGSKIQPVTVLRQGPGYNSLESQGFLASASGIRHAFFSSEKGSDDSWKQVLDFIPEETMEILKGIPQDEYICWNDLYPHLMYRILSSSEKELGKALAVSEGLEHRLKKAASSAVDMETLLSGIKSKRYTETRIRRALIHVLSGFARSDFFEIMDENILYGRVLGFSKTGAKLLKYIKKNETGAIPILTNINKELLEDDPAWKLLKWDILSADITNFMRRGQIRERSDYVMKPFMTGGKGENAVKKMS